MGLTHVKVQIANPQQPDDRTTIDFLVDSGAMYSLVPATILRELGIEPHSRREFVLANGEVVSRNLGTAVFETQGQRGDSLVIFVEEGDQPLLGATTMEGFGLILDPFSGESKPLPMRL